MKGPDHIDGDYIDALTAKARRFERRWRNAPQQRDNGPEPDAEARTIAYSKVKPEAVEWLWPGRIPLGMLTLLIGDPGLGKSLLTLKLAAELSGTADALILSAEDSHAVTIRPRLEALEAELEQAEDAGGDTAELLGRIIEIERKLDPDWFTHPANELADPEAVAETRCRWGMSPHQRQREELLRAEWERWRYQRSKLPKEKRSKEMMRVGERECRWCGGFFEPSTLRQRYCLPRCRLRAHRDRGS